MKVRELFSRLSTPNPAADRVRIGNEKKGDVKDEAAWGQQVVDEK